MNSLIKITFASIALAILAGCAPGIKEAPKTAAEMQANGTDNLLNVPVDVSNFAWKKQEITAANGDTGIVTVFTSPEGKTYDVDGQPVNEKAERILKDGYVCKVSLIQLGYRSYATRSGFGWDHHESCMTNSFNEQRKITPTKLGIAFVGGAAIAATGGGIVAATALGGAAPMLTLDTSGDTK